ncbi:hypothetical protein OBBRIDRAFT_389161 [Obba rivulosa]|uniref:BTB domain-containing protein n=1 Tax=Obba rivulosa TaxID=1052685 RepID=A0A8E2AHK9_9APHY|nr:hypothetical protein OBBRIDRAFT_389161 [Obba rivulosa]
MTHAGPPFNKASADTIIRSADGVEFRVRRSILEESSQVFEDMFTLPQGKDDVDAPQRVPGSHGIPVVEVTEDSTTLDCLLRLCYPVPPPTFDSVNLVGSVLDAAMKYMMDHASSVMIGHVVAMTASHPAEVFAISARHELAKEAQGTLPYLRALLDEGGENISVTELEVVPALPLFRLLSESEDSMCRLFEITSSDPPSASDRDCLDNPPPYPFDTISLSDAAIRSSDGILFHVHTQVLYFAAPALYEKLVSAGDEPLVKKPDPTRHIHLLVVEEKSRILYELLRLCYPLDNSAQPAYYYVRDLIPPARKYGMQAVLTKLRTALTAFVDTADADEDLEFAGYALACANGLENEARNAARRFLRRNEHFEHSWKVEVFMENLSAAAYFRLLQYRKTCSRIAGALADGDMPPMAREGGYIWNACILCECDDSQRPLTSDSPRQWWTNFMRDTAIALRRFPCGSTVLLDNKRFNDAVRAASSCSNCGRWAAAHLRDFVNRFAAHIDTKLAAVPLEVK